MCINTVVFNRSRLAHRRTMSASREDTRKERRQKEEKKGKGKHNNEKPGDDQVSKKPNLQAAAGSSRALSMRTQES